MTASPATGSDSARRGRRRGAAVPAASGTTGRGAAPPAGVSRRPEPISIDAAGPPERPAPTFAHASEAEMARILDYYRIAWEYEPHTFPILWNLEGAVVESFSPDFWLPDLDLYLEMTTLRQKLVRKKNRKLRRIKELYPGIRVKLFYARDFRALLLKFGRLALADGLSGTSGQVIRERLGIDSVLIQVDADVNLDVDGDAAPAESFGAGPSSAESLSTRPGGSA